MKELELVQRIATLMSRFVTEVRALNAISLYDINNISENVLIPLFKEAYDFNGLRNLNTEHHKNYPGIDLADPINRVAIQVTASTDSKKIKHTLEQFVRHNHFEKYDHLLVYILTEKQGRYQGKGFKEIIGGRFHFTVDEDILDYTDFMQRVEGLPFEKVKSIAEILEQQFADNRPGVVIQNHKGNKRPPRKETLQESIFANLLEIHLPEDIYIGTRDYIRKDVIKNAKGTEFEISNRASARQVAFTALRLADLKFGSDWVIHEKQFLSFHDLGDPDVPLSELVDPGTVDKLTPEEYYEQGDDYKRVFVRLLRRCLQKKLYQDGVLWDHKEGVFVFSPADGEAKRNESWHGAKDASRMVFQTHMKKKEPSEVYYCQHLAFQANFKHLNNKWYLLIAPEWYMSKTGELKKWYWGFEKVDYLKRQERNQQLFNHTKFIAHFIKHGKPSDLFQVRYPYKFLKFGKLLSVETPLIISEEKWKINESEKELKRLADTGGTLPLPY
ncbi:MAG: SMEK domain-containing protein [Bacteroidetes bacterium]|nr:SMEK domain-containing protein [Bacteroidota bacterium]